MEDDNLSLRKLVDSPAQHIDVKTDEIPQDEESMLFEKHNKSILQEHPLLQLPEIMFETDESKLIRVNDDVNMESIQSENNKSESNFQQKVYVGEQNRDADLDFMEKDRIQPILPGKDEDTFRYLKYGDKIKLYMKVSQEKYYVHSDGFASERVYAHNRNDLNGFNETFRVIPKGESFYTNKLMQELKARINEKNNIREDPAKGNKVSDRIYNEIKETKVTHETLIGTPIKYGDKFQLIHDETMQYLSVSKNIETSDKRLKQNDRPDVSGLHEQLTTGVQKDILRVYSLKLSPYSSPKTLFMFLPSYKYQENGFIVDEDSFYFTYEDNSVMKTKFYLCPPQMDSVGNMMSRAVYLYDSMKYLITYEKEDDKYLADHLFKELHRKTIWITHIEVPLLLTLEMVEKSKEEQEGEYGNLMIRVGEAKIQRFRLEFKPYAPTAPLPFTGLWIVTAGRESSDKALLKHIL